MTIRPSEKGGLQGRSRIDVKSFEQIISLQEYHRKTNISF